MKDIRFNMNAVYDPNNLMIRFITEYNKKRNKIIEESLQLVIKPKPKFMPSFVWQWCLNKMMYIKYKGGK